MKATMGRIRRASQHGRPAMGTVWVLAIALVCGCAHDLYRERTDAIKDHVKAFYTDLEADRVQAAVHQNEQIEAIGTEMETGFGAGPTNPAPMKWIGTRPWREARTTRPRGIGSHSQDISR